LIWNGIVSARDGDENIKHHLLFKVVEGPRTFKRTSDLLFKVVEGPRTFKRTSEDSKGIPRCYLWKPFAPALKGPDDTICELNKSGAIAIAIGIILAKRKEGILCYLGHLEPSLNHLKPQS